MADYTDKNHLKGLSRRDFMKAATTAGFIGVLAGYGCTIFKMTVTAYRSA